MDVMDCLEAGKEDKFCLFLLSSVFLFSLLAVYNSYRAGMY